MTEEQKYIDFEAYERVAEPTNVWQSHINVSGFRLGVLQ